MKAPITTYKGKLAALTIALRSASLSLSDGQETGIRGLITEITGKYDGVTPGGFTIQSFDVAGQPGTHQQYAVNASITDPWPLDEKLFCGIGFTLPEALHKLDAQIADWFATSDMGWLNNPATHTLKPEHRADFPEIPQTA